MPKHSEQKVLPYRPEQLFELVADVGRYPEFLPWCLAARILKQGDARLEAELVIGFKGIKERFVSIVDLDRTNHRIDVTYQEGPFKFLENHWHFLSHDKDSCLLDFNVDFEFRSRLLQTVIGPLFNEAVRRMVHAFETRAEDLYGATAGDVDANSHSPA